MVKKGQTVTIMPRQGIVQAGGRQLMTGDTATVIEVKGSLVTVRAGSNGVNTVTLRDSEVRGE